MPASVRLKEAVTRTWSGGARADDINQDYKGPGSILALTFTHGLHEKEPELGIRYLGWGEGSLLHSIGLYIFNMLHTLRTVFVAVSKKPSHIRLQKQKPPPPPFVNASSDSNAQMGKQSRPMGPLAKCTLSEQSQGPGAGARLSLRANGPLSSDLPEP